MRVLFCFYALESSLKPLFCLLSTRYKRIFTIRTARSDAKTYIHIWWLNPLEDEQPVEPWARIQPPVRIRRRGRPRNPRREPSAFEIVQAQAAARAENRANVGEGRAENWSRGRGPHRVRGRNADRGRDIGRSQSRECKGLRRGGQIEGNLTDDEYVLVN